MEGKWWKRIIKVVKNYEKDVKGEGRSTEERVEKGERKRDTHNTNSNTLLEIILDEVR